MLRKRIILLLVLLLAAGADVYAQKLSFANHREVKIPEYALLRIGSFYSNVSFKQEAGYRYTRGEGTGTDFLFANRRGVIKEDGDEFPLVTTLQFKNYLLVTRNMDLDFSAKIVSEQYPLGTQSDTFYLDMADEGIFGTLSTEIALTPFVKMYVYENAKYKTDYVDTRGFIDEWGGQEYEHFANDAGLNLDWMMAPGENLHFDFARKDVIPMGSDDAFSNQERVEWSEGVSYERELSMFMTGGIRAAAGQSEYAVTNRAGSSLYSGSLFANARVTRRTVVDASVGYSKGSSDSLEQSSVDAGKAPDVAGTVIGGLSLNTEINDDMMQTYGYMRSHRGGFTSAFEVWSSIFYRFNWIGDFTTMTILSQRNLVETGRSISSEYSDWRNSIMISRKLLSFMTLDCMLNYTIRDNEYEASGAEGAESVDVEWTDDYDTWSAKIGTTFTLTKKIDFRTSVHRVERVSSKPDLDYSRDLFEAMFIFSHDF